MRNFASLIQTTTMRLFFTLLTLLAGCVAPLFAQVSGKILDAQGQPLPFANAIVYQGEKLIKGAVSDADGVFSIDGVKKGNYTLRLQMIGYEIKDIPVSVVQAKRPVFVGDVTLSEESHKVDEVSVVAQKQTMKLEIDRKVFDVSQDIASSGGSASDVLENIPSVEVDSEGNVSLRGSQSVTVWINGKAQGLTSDNRGDILQQLPSESIDHVEVITNPSSKYSPEGSAGIINIVLKKDRKAGYYGGVQLSVNSEKGGRVGTNINYCSSKFDAYLNLGYGRRKHSNGGSTERDFLGADGEPTGFLNSSNSGKSKGNHIFLRAGASLHISENDEITLGYMGMFGSGDRNTDIDYELDNYAGFQLLDPYFRTRHSGNSDDMTMNDADLSYRHTWETGHFIEASFNASGWNMDGDTYYDQNTYYYADIPYIDRPLTDEELAAIVHNAYQRQRNTISTKEFEARLDYEQPVGSVGKLEAGYQGNFSRENSPTETFADEACTSSIESLFNRFKYDSDINALYANWKHTLTPIFGYQVGLRGEWWQVRTSSYSFDQEYNGVEPDKFKKNYAALFPTAYLSLKVSEAQELQLNYTRRLQRPWGGQMNSFKNISDSANISFGNPLLTPEYTHSLELNYIRNWDDHTLSLSAYYRPSSDVIQQVSYVEGGVRFTTNQNVARSLSSGLEIVGKNRLWKRLDLTTTLNVFYHKLDGGDFEMTTDAGSRVGIHVDDDDDFSWNVREMASLMLPKEFTFQATFRYEAPTVITQGERKASHVLDAGVRKQFAGRKFNLALNCRDLLDSREWRTTSSGEGFSQESRSWWGGRRFILQFAWSFGNMNAKATAPGRQPASGYGDNGGGDE